MFIGSKDSNLIRPWLPNYEHNLERSQVWVLKDMPTKEQNKLIEGNEVINDEFEKSDECSVY